MDREEEILAELRIIRQLLEKVLVNDNYGGVDFRTCLERIMYGAEE